MKRLLLISTAIIFAFALLGNSCNMKPKQQSDKLRKKEIWVDLLRQNMHTQSEWIKVHAAEFLLWSGYPEGVKSAFLEEERLNAERSPYRIGIWRVLAQSEENREKKEVWIGRIMNAYMDDTGPDRLHAIETLAKLKISPFSNQIQVADFLSEDSINVFTVFQLWSFAYTSETAYTLAENALLDITLALEQSVPVRSASAFALSRLGGLDSLSWRLLAGAALMEEDEILKVNLLNTATVTVPGDRIATPLYTEVKDGLLRLSEKYENNSFKISVFDALSAKGEAENLDGIFSMLDKIQPAKDAGSADVLSYGAYAVLKITQRLNIE